MSKNNIKFYKMKQISQILIVLAICLPLSVPTSLDAQLLSSQKIVLLEPRVGDSTSTISVMEKALLRGELRKSITSITGEEVFSNVLVDQKVNEAGFQKTGIISIETLSMIENMSIADKILVTTIYKSESEFFLEAYLLDIKTGGISNMASQYGKLTGGKFENLTPIQELAKEMFGTNNNHQNTNEIAQQTVIPTKENYSLGSLISFNDGTSGIIFYLSSSEGLAVSLVEISAKWENVNDSHECHDLALTNSIGESYLVPGLGAENSKIILKELGNEQAPAVSYCVNLGDGWYLPSSGELWTLLLSANEGLGAQGFISKKLIMAGGTPLKYEWYWSSTENDQDGAINVKYSGRINTENKYEILPVRAVRHFFLQ